MTWTSELAFLLASQEPGFPVEIMPIKSDDLSAHMWASFFEIIKPAPSRSTLESSGKDDQSSRNISRDHQATFWSASTGSN